MVSQAFFSSDSFEGEVKIKKLQKFMSQQIPWVYPKSHLGEETEMTAPSLRGRLQDFPKEKLFKNLVPGLDDSQWLLQPCPGNIKRPSCTIMQHWRKKRRAVFCPKSQQLQAAHPLVAPAVTQGRWMERFYTHWELKNSINAQLGVVGAFLTTDQQEGTG